MSRRYPDVHELREGELLVGLYVEGTQHMPRDVREACYHHSENSACLMMQVETVDITFINAPHRQTWIYGNAPTRGEVKTVMMIKFNRR